MANTPRAPTSAPPHPQGNNPAIAAAVQSVLHPQQQQQFQVQVQNLPFPPPEIMRAYESISPGTFDRLIKMAEQAQRDQTETIRIANAHISAHTRWGQVLGSLVSLAAIAGAVWCAKMNQPWVSGILVGVPVMAVARALIESTKSRPQQQIAVQPPLPLG